MADEKVFDASTTDEEIAAAKSLEVEQRSVNDTNNTENIIPTSTNTFVKPAIQNGETK